MLCAKLHTHTLLIKAHHNYLSLSLFCFTDPSLFLPSLRPQNYGLSKQCAHSTEIKALFVSYKKNRPTTGSVLYLFKKPRKKSSGQSLHRGRSQGFFLISHSRVRSSTTRSFDSALRPQSAMRKTKKKMCLIICHFLCVSSS